MGMYTHLNNFFDTIVQDDVLLRLLIHKSTHAEDDPLCPSKPDIIDTPEYITAITKNIIRAPKSTDIADISMCRLCIYMGANMMSSDRKNSNKVFFQDIILDVYVHIDDFEAIDCRSLKICDRLNVLLHEERISGIGRVESYKTFPINNAPDGHIGYRMVFSFGSTK